MIIVTTRTIARMLFKKLVCGCVCECACVCTRHTGLYVQIYSHTHTHTHTNFDHDYDNKEVMESLPFEDSQLKQD